MTGYTASRVVVSSAVHSVESAGLLIWHALRVAIDSAMAPTVDELATTLHAVYSAAFHATLTDVCGGGDGGGGDGGGGDDDREQGGGGRQCDGGVGSDDSDGS